MFGWLRDTLTNARSSFEHHHSITPSSVFHQQKQKQKERTSSDDDELNQSKDNSFYHNPYQSSGQMNYIDVPQQQYTNEHTYPTYLARQQISDSTNQTLDDQIHAKLLSLQQRSNQCQSYAHRQNNYAHRNRSITATTPSSTLHSSLILNRNEQRRRNNEERSDDDDEDDDDEDDDDDDDEEEEENDGDGDNGDDNDHHHTDDDRRSSSIENNLGIAGYYSGRYANIDEQFDLASVVLWYKNVMQSVKKFLPTGHNYIHSEKDEYNNHHYSISSKNSMLSKTTNQENILSNNENEQVTIPLSSSKVKWIDAVRTVTQLNQKNIFIMLDLRT
ncbi:unnamed protein product [Rotaria magnacalcarata]|uniref:Uncharacterized protein n=1 Tax=Rotaria magnacalcarata TaxID=392030 RepID=A0A819A3H9_9BILA|nr:unnamed protein product [Rotaria magnacalcarata]CAF4000008.1 unnamed protein product [Rotaria magnacalcarata]